MSLIKLLTFLKCVWVIWKK